MTTMVAPRWQARILGFLLGFLFLGAIAATMANCQLPDFRPAMTVKTQDIIAHAWENRAILGTDACVFGFVDDRLPVVHLTITSILPTNTPMDTCPFSADSLIGGLHFSDPDAFNQAADSVTINGILSEFPKFHYFGLVYGVMRRGDHYTIQVFQIERFDDNTHVTRMGLLWKSSSKKSH